MLLNWTFSCVLLELGLLGLSLPRSTCFRTSSPPPFFVPYQSCGLDLLDSFFFFLTLLNWTWNDAILPVNTGHLVAPSFLWGYSWGYCCGIWNWRTLFLICRTSKWTCPEHRLYSCRYPVRFGFTWTGLQWAKPFLPGIGWLLLTCLLLCLWVVCLFWLLLLHLIPFQNTWLHGISLHYSETHGLKWNYAYFYIDIFSQQGRCTQEEKE